MKKNYQKPAMRVVTIKGQQHILEASVGSVYGNVFNEVAPEGSNGVARGRRYDDWSDVDNEY